MIINTVSQTGTVPTRLDVNKTLSGDPVFDTENKRWLMVIEIVDDVIVAEANNLKDGFGVVVTVSASDCTACWNPLHKCFGRRDENDRAKFWLPIPIQRSLF